MLGGSGQALEAVERPVRRARAAGAAHDQRRRSLVDAGLGRVAVEVVDQLEQLAQEELAVHRGPGRVEAQHLLEELAVLHPDLPGVAAVVRRRLPAQAAAT